MSRVLTNARAITYRNSEDNTWYAIVPEGATGLGMNLFRESSIKKVFLPDTLLSIGSNCFSLCSNLEEIILPNSLKSIDKSAFYSCKKLKKINIPKNLTYIHETAFIGCGSLTAFEADKDNPCFASDENGILYDKNFETIIAVPQSFYDGKKELVLPEVKAVQKYAFDNCKSRYLERIVIPESISEVPDNAFHGAQCRLVWHGMEIPHFPLQEEYPHGPHETLQYMYMNYLFRLLSKRDFKLMCYYDVEFSMIQKIYENVTELNESQLKASAKVMMDFIDKNNREMTEAFLDMKIFVTQDNIDEIIRHAIEQQNYDIQLMLTEYKRKYIGYRDITERLKL